MKCSICGRIFSEDTPGVAMPFCSQRCKLIDAGRWLNEEYGLSIEDDESILQSGESSENFLNRKNS
ncbi:MAG: DNA gyrase inhibitor YacG [Planctomycetaceae bacterium]|jgi:endogenous inhibitor of DNA gyrase (YacG/DUF329 family)|nr:DNA gyrase inhibitor YacG [Planctomycetaceae bacterium]